jgi:hypothetical protein
MMIGKFDHETGHRQPPPNKLLQSVAATSCLLPERAWLYSNMTDSFTSRSTGETSCVFDMSSTNMLK